MQSIYEVFQFIKNLLERNPGNIRTYTLHYNMANFCPDVLTRYYIKLPHGELSRINIVIKHLYVTLLKVLPCIFISTNSSLISCPFHQSMTELFNKFLPLLQLKLASTNTARPLIPSMPSRELCSPETTLPLPPTCKNLNQPSRPHSMLTLP